MHVLKCRIICTRTRKGLSSNAITKIWDGATAHSGPNEAATILHLYASCAQQLQRYPNTSLADLAPEYEAMQVRTMRGE